MILLKFNSPLRLVHTLITISKCNCRTWQFAAPGVQIASPSSDIKYFWFLWILIKQLSNEQYPTVGLAKFYTQAKISVGGPMKWSNWPSVGHPWLRSAKCLHSLLHCINPDCLTPSNMARCQCQNSTVPLGLLAVFGTKGMILFWYRDRSGGRHGSLAA
jgi:hypothetical protein